MHDRAFGLLPRSASPANDVPVVGGGNADSRLASGVVPSRAVDYYSPNRQVDSLGESIGRSEYAQLTFAKI